MRVYLWIVLMSLSQDSSSKVQELKVDVDFRGDDFEQIYSLDVQQCQRACTQHPSCLFFTFLRADWSKDNRKFYCYLKHTVSGLPSQVKNLEGVTSGFALHSKYKTVKELKVDVDFPGNDFVQTYSSDAQQCQFICTRHPSCLFFTFIRPDWSVDNRKFYCYLKHTASRMPSQVTDLKGVTSGFSLRPDYNTIQELKVDVDFNGDDVMQIYSPDALHCQLACTQHHSCLFFTFVRADWSQDNRKFYCYLKHTASGMPSRVMDLKGVTSGFSFSSEYKTDACLPSLYLDTDFTGSDYLQLNASSSDDCQKQCTSDPGCKFFSFTTETFPDATRRKWCFLKYSWTVPIPLEIHNTFGLIAGFSDSLYKAKGTEKECQKEILADTDYPGNDFENVPAASPLHCQYLCSTHPRCTHFSYASSKYTTSNTWYHMRCFLKYVPDVSQLEPTRVEEIFSGFPTQNCDPSNVWVTTRYGGFDFYGYDNHYVLVDTSESCREMCTADPYCQFYTYVLSAFHDRKLWHRCYMKQVMILPRPKMVVYMRGVISGFSLRNCNIGKDESPAQLGLLV